MSLPAPPLGLGPETTLKRPPEPRRISGRLLPLATSSKVPTAPTVPWVSRPPPHTVKSPPRVPAPRHVLERAAAEPLDERPGAGRDVVRLADGPYAAVAGRHAEEHARGGALGGGRDHGPRAAVPVLDERLVG